MKIRGTHMTPEAVKKMVDSKLTYEESPSLIRMARLRAHITQSHLAKILNYSYTTFGEIERGRRPVRSETAKLIAEVLKSEVSKLFTPIKHKFIARKS